QLGLRIGDVIEEINGERVLSYDDIYTGVAKAGELPLRLVVVRKGERLVLGEGRDVRPVRDPLRGVPSLGVTIPTGLWLAAVHDYAGMRTEGVPLAGWTLESIDEESLVGGIGQQAELILKRRVGTPVTLGFRRPDGSYFKTTEVYAGSSSPIDLAIGLPVRISDQPKPGTPAGNAGLNVGDLIVAINDVPVTGQAHFVSLVQNAANAADASMRLSVWSPGAEAAREVRITAVLDVDSVMRLQLPIESADSGWLPVLPNALGAQANGLACSGMKPGDTLLDLQLDSVDRAARTVGARVLSGGTPELIALAPPQELPKRALKVLGKLIGHRVDTIVGTSGGDIILRIADLPGQGTDISLSSLPASARDALGALKQGDWIVRPQRLVDGRIGIEVLRGAAAAQVMRVPLHDVGIALRFELDKTPYQLSGWTDAFTLANHQTKKMVVDTLTIIPKFFRPANEGGIDATKSLSGPIGIFGALRAMFDRFGFAAFLQLVALIGLNLFLVNLLPIPVVDGGQLAFLAMEAVMRRPLPDIVKTVATGLGVVLIVSLMLFVLSLDILRLAGWI
nr:site-2 protease family protein [Planctomycetota bacterium]